MYVQVDEGSRKVAFNSRNNPTKLLFKISLFHLRDTLSRRADKIKVLRSLLRDSCPSARRNCSESQVRRRRRRPRKENDNARHSFVSFGFFRKIGRCSQEFIVDELGSVKPNLGHSQMKRRKKRFRPRRSKETKLHPSNRSNNKDSSG